MKFSGVYAIEHTSSGRVYIGSSKNISSRLREHLSYLLKGDHHSQYLQNSWNKYGESYFQFKIIEKCSIDTLIDREQFWIDFYHSYIEETGFNIRRFADRREHTEKTKEQIRRKLSGIPFSKEHKQKISLALKGKRRSYKYVLSEETKQKIRNALIGRSHTEEMKNKLRGRNISEETKEKVRLTWRDPIAREKRIIAIKEGIKESRMMKAKMRERR